MSELTEKEFEQKAVLTLLANPEFIRVCNERAKDDRKKFQYQIAVASNEFIGFLNTKKPPKNQLV